MTTPDEPLKIEHGKHPNSIANLAKGRAKLVEMRKNGELLNPNGYSLKSRLLNLLDKPLVKPGEDSTVGDQLAYSSIEGAILREPTPFREVWDRVDGKLQDAQAPFQDNRVINIIVSSEKAKELTEGVGEFGIFNRELLKEG